MSDLGESTCSVKPVAIPGKEDQVFIPSDNLPLFLTPAAIEAIKEVLSDEGKDQSGIRVSVVGGGCSGYQYNLGFEDSARDEDYCFVVDGINMFLDPISDCYLRGTVIDFVAEEQEHGFKFLNPNPRRRCGCSSAAV